MMNTINNVDDDKIIKDCIYGHVRVPALCVKYIDQPEFQRLHRVKQLGNCWRVYPSATHTRFEHCIGVMHLAGEMCKALGYNGNERVVHLIQLAGLYHDIGHLPYSHLFDHILEIVKPINIPFYKHEDRSIATFVKVSKELGLLNDNEISFVSACIKGESMNSSISSSSLSQQYTLIDGTIIDKDHDAYLFQVIASKVDVDRLDYLCRDAYHTGMPSFQANYIIMNVRIDKETRKLAFRENARRDINRMFQTREDMHHHVYQHRVSLEYDTMYMCMIFALLENNAIEEELDEDLCDYRLDSLLLTSEITRETYLKMEKRLKNHENLCICQDKNHPIRIKEIPYPGSLDKVIFVL